jgi:26S proteasome regulatory subunit N4
MGFTLPSSSAPSPADHVRTLVSRKGAIEAELSAHISVLEANSCTMHTPLVDGEGFPRDDIDIYAVRTARVRVIELRNDLKGAMDEIAKGLQVVYAPDASGRAASESGESVSDGGAVPFAKVGAVSPTSPAAEAASTSFLSPTRSNLS